MYIDLEDRILDVLSTFIGMKPSEIEARLKESLNPQSKSYYRLLSERMMRSDSVVYRDYYRSGISLKTVRIDSDGMPRESMSFPYFRFDDMLAQEWDNSDFKEQLTHRFLFMVFESEKETDTVRFMNAAFWSCSEDNLTRISEVWEHTKEKIQAGQDDFTPKSAGRLAHVRPHGASSNDTYLFNGVPQKKYSFWLNNDYVAEILKTLPTLHKKIEPRNEPADKCSLGSRIVRIVSESEEPIKPFKLKTMLQDCCTPDEFNMALLTLVNNGQVRRTSFGLQCAGLSLEDMLEDAPQYVREYFNTNDLEGYCSIQRAEREIIENDVRAFFTVRPIEDSLSFDFSTYNFTKKQFLEVYEVSQTVYRYLELMHPHGWKDSYDLLYDQSKADSFKNRLRNALFDRINIDGKVVTLTEQGIIDYVLTLADKPLAFAEVSRRYKEFIKKNGLGNEPFASMSSTQVRDLANAEGTYILKYDGASIVRFPFSSKDVVKLLEKLDLQQYDNQYISAGLLLSRNPSEFTDMGIETEMEVFMLFSKYKDSPILKERHMLPVSPPSLKFGNGSIDEQIVNLLRETGRITKNDFCTKYTELYGVKEQSIKAYMSKHPEYSHGLYYDINLPVLPDDVVECLRSLFKKAIISHEEAQNLFKKAEMRFGLQIADSGSEDQYYNVNNIRSLGYARDKTCIFTNRYQSLAECIESEYLSGDFIDITSEMRNNNMIMSMLEDRIKSREIYAFGSDSYISAERLHSCDVSDDMLEDYCENACTYLPVGRYYTLHFLREMGFEHPLEDLGFEYYFYEGLLERHSGVSSSSINNVKVFTTGIYNRSEALADIASAALGEKGSEDVDDLADDIENLFGIQMQNLLKRIKPLRYCKHTRKIYRDDETYIEEMRRA